AFNCSSSSDVQGSPFLFNAFATVVSRAEERGNAVPLPELVRPAAQWRQGSRETIVAQDSHRTNTMGTLGLSSTDLSCASAVGACVLWRDMILILACAAEVDSSSPTRGVHQGEPSAFDRILRAGESPPASGDNQRTSVFRIPSVRSSQS